MNTDKATLIHRQLTERVLGAFYDVYNELGNGFLEGVYENALAVSLREAGIAAEQQVPIQVRFRGTAVGDFRADLVVERDLIIEIKAVTTLISSHEAQLLNYLKATGRPLGLLLNFGPRPQFRRMIFTDGSIRVHPRKSVAKNHV